MRTTPPPLEGGGGPSPRPSAVSLRAGRPLAGRQLATRFARPGDEPRPGEEPMNDAPTLSQRADALEEQMSRELDYIVIKSRLYSMAEGDMGPPPNAAALMA